MDGEDDRLMGEHTEDAGVGAQVDDGGIMDEEYETDHGDVGEDEEDVEQDHGDAGEGEEGGEGEGQDSSDDVDKGRPKKKRKRDESGKVSVRVACSASALTGHLVQVLPEERWARMKASIGYRYTLQELVDLVDTPLGNDRVKNENQAFQRLFSGYTSVTRVAIVSSRR